MSFWERFIPDCYLKNITHIPIEELINAGYNAILLDLDNTLLAWKDSYVSDDVKNWITLALSKNMKIMIISNTHYPKRIQAISQDLGVEFMAQAMKPRKSCFIRSLNQLQTIPQKAVLVGDQLITDICGGNLCGLYTILVDPIHKREFVGTKISRAIEYFIKKTKKIKICSATNCSWTKSK